MRRGTPVSPSREVDWFGYLFLICLAVLLGGAALIGWVLHA